MAATAAPALLVHTSCSHPLACSSQLFHADRLIAAPPGGVPLLPVDAAAVAVEFALTSVRNPAGVDFDLFLLCDSELTQRATDFAEEYHYDESATWFPGYAWRSVYYGRCDKSVGWKYQRQAPAPAWGSFEGFCCRSRRNKCTDPFKYFFAFNSEVVRFEEVPLQRRRLPSEFDEEDEEDERSGGQQQEEQEDG